MYLSLSSSYCSIDESKYYEYIDKHGQEPPDDVYPEEYYDGCWYDDFGKEGVTVSRVEIKDSMHIVKISTDAELYIRSHLGPDIQKIGGENKAIWTDMTKVAKVFYSDKYKNRIATI